MNILVIGSDASFQEVNNRFGATHGCQSARDHTRAHPLLPSAEVVFDFLLMDDPACQHIYSGYTGRVFVHSVNKSLTGAIAHRGGFFFGFNGWPGSFERPLLEVALFRANQREALATCCAQLRIDYRMVDDRVGLVTPRVISMLINEAFYTVQDGTATRNDIDRAMQLGTNYPLGPFAWCACIGIQNIYRLLDALHNDTHDERYKIAWLLKKEYLQSLH